MISFSRYRQETQAQAAQLASGSRLVDTTAGPVEFGQVGAGQCVILSHGTLGGYDQGLWLGSLLGPGYNYLAPSRFGYLRTPLPQDPSPASQAGQYAALLDALQIERAAVIGISAGGPSSIQFALAYPERCSGLVLISAISRRLTAIPLYFRVLLFGLMKSNFLPWLAFQLNPASIYRSNGVNRALLAQLSRDPEKMQLLRDLAATSMLPALRRAGMMNDWEQSTQMPSYPLARTKVPTLVVHAVNDPVVAYDCGQFSAAQIPGAHLLTVEDGGHFCCVTHREVVVPVINRFLNSCFS